MASSVPSAPPHAPHTPDGPITMFGPDFPFAYDDWVRHPAGLGAIPEEAHGREVAIVGGGLAGVLAAYELMKLGLRPVVHEADRLGGRLRSETFEGLPGVVAEMGAMRFPPSSTTLYHYIDTVGLETTPFPNPLSDATPSTVIDLKGVTHYARTPEDLPGEYREVARAWDRALEDGARLGEMQAAIRRRDAAAIKAIWDPLVAELDDVSFYGFLAAAEPFGSFSRRELFGQVGFGTGGWDTDFPNSMLEILRVIYTGADDEHRSIVGGSQQLPERLWHRAPETLAHWPAGTTLASLHEGGVPRPGVAELHRTAPANLTITDRTGDIRTYPAAVFTAQGWMLLSAIRSDEALFPIDVWTAIERTHYMQSSKTFVAVDRPFWRDRDPETGHDAMSMTLTDRMPRGTYLLEGPDPDGPAVICLSYTWTDDSSKWLALGVRERVDVALDSLKAIYPKVDVRRHIVANPITISWEREPCFMGAFKANLPGHYRYQRRLYTHFVQDGLVEEHRGLFLAGDDVSWTAGWAEGAVQTALNAVWGVMKHFGGATDPANPGPGDAFGRLAPVELPES